MTSHGLDRKRRYTWRGTVTTLVMLLAASLTSDGRHGLRALFRLSLDERRQLYLAGLALFCNKALMAYASLTHAAFFDSTATLWLVVGQVIASDRS